MLILKQGFLKLLLLLLVLIFTACQQVPKPQIKPEIKTAEIIKEIKPEAKPEIKEELIVEEKAEQKLGQKLDQKVEVKPDQPPIPEVIEPLPKVDPLKANFELATWSVKNGQHDKAIQYLEEIVMAEETYPLAWTNLGLLLLNQKQQSQAENAFIQALKVNQSDAIAANHLAVIYRNKGLFSQSLALYQKAILIDQDYANAHLNLAILYDLYLQQFNLALEHYLTFKKLTKSNNETVEKWISDLQRRIKSQTKK